MVNGSHPISRCLFICAHAPTRLYPQAGQKIALDRLEEYAAIANKIDIVVIANKTEIDAASDLFQKFTKNLYVYPLSKLAKINNCLRHLLIPFKFSTRYQNGIAARLQTLIAQYNYDIIHFEYSHAAVYLEFLQRVVNSQTINSQIINSQTINPQTITSQEEINSQEIHSQKLNSQKTNIIISIHDIISHSFLRKSANNIFLGMEVARLFRYEKSLYSSANKLWVLSQKDCDILTSLFTIPTEKIIVKPPNLTQFIENTRRVSENIEPKTLLFWGAMNRPENEKGILVFVEKCFKTLLTKHPDFKLYIVGYKPSKKILKLANKNIIVTGFVQDPTPFFEKAEIGIVPLLEGAGIKLKTLEMLEVGLPVIATGIGAEGIDGKNKRLLINDDFNEWVYLIEHLSLSKSKK